MKPRFKNYKYFKLTVTFVALQMLLFSCDKFEYSPYEIRLPEDMRDINRKNINRILDQHISAADTLKFVITSDTQGFYVHNEALVNHINQNQDISFILHNGDITDFGLLKEHKWIHDSFKNLKAPYVTVIGNHDATGNGQDLYSAMYGDFDFSFVAANRKFIFLNTNHWEFKGQVPDLEWLERELQNTAQYQNTFVISHIPPNSDAFGADKIDKYKALLRHYNVSLSIHGHGHGFNYSRVNENDVYEMEVASTDKREYVVMSLIGNKIDFKRVNF